MSAASLVLGAEMAPGTSTRMNEQTRPDQDLVRRMRNGDEDAFSEFFDQHFDRLFRFSLRRLRGDEDAAEEVVQTVMMRAMRKLNTYRGEAPLFTWLCTFCRFEISAHFVRAGRRGLETAIDEVDLDDATAALARAPEEDPEVAYRRKETAALVHDALDELPAHYGNALEWKYVEGLSVDEVADRLRLGAKTTE